MITISIITQKGGVGKTTSSINLGGAFAKLGKRVLLIDLDGQCNLTQGLKIKEDFPFNIKDFLDGGEGFKLSQRAENLMVLSGSELIEENLHLYKRDLLKEGLFLLEKKGYFDICIIDCPPRPLLENRVTLGELALVASDYVLCPLHPEEYGAMGVKKLIPNIFRIKKNFNSKLEFLGFYFNQVLTNTTKYKEYFSRAEMNQKDYFFTTSIRQDMIVEKAKDGGMTVFEFGDNHRVCIDFLNLANEINFKIKKYE